MVFDKGKWVVDLSKDWDAAPEKAPAKFYTFKTKSERKKQAITKAVSGLLNLSKQPRGEGGKAMEEDEDLLTQKWYSTLDHKEMSEKKLEDQKKKHENDSETELDDTEYDFYPDNFQEYVEMAEAPTSTEKVHLWFHHQNKTESQNLRKGTKGKRKVDSASAEPNKMQKFLANQEEGKWAALEAKQFACEYN